MLMVPNPRLRLRVQTKTITMPCARSKYLANLCHPCVQVYHCRLSTAGSPLTRPLLQSSSLSLCLGFTLPKSASQMPPIKHSKQPASLASAQPSLFLLPTQCPVGVLQVPQSHTLPEDLPHQPTATHCDRTLPNPSHKQPVGQPSTSTRDPSALSMNTTQRTTRLNLALPSDPS
jgi:hypothetical protein